MRRQHERGLSFVEVVVSMAIALAVTGSMFGIIHSIRGVFEIDLERADMQQRARMSADSLFRDLVMAGAGAYAPAVAPYRRGDSSPDPAGAAFANRLSVMYAPPDAAAGERVMHTYALRADAAGVMQLTRYDGVSTELPLADRVSDLRFEYFDAAGAAMTLDRFVDGPWIPNAVAPDRYDVDLQAIRRVRAFLRVQPARTILDIPLSDVEVFIDVVPRNLNAP